MKIKDILHKLTIVICIVSLMSTLAACGKRGVADSNEQQSTANENSDDADSEDSDFEDEDEDSEDEDLEYESDDDEEDEYAISMSDADNLIEECLYGSGCEYVISSRIDEEESFYVYDIFYNDEVIDQQLAVNTQSGTVLVYDYEKDKMYPLSKFEYYNAETDPDIDFTGVYGHKKMDLVILVDEPGGFEFVFYKGENALVGGYAQEENRVKANGEADGQRLTFELDGTTVRVTSDKPNSKYVGDYEMK